MEIKNGENKEKELLRAFSKWLGENKMSYDGFSLWSNRHIMPHGEGRTIYYSNDQVVDKFLKFQEDRERIRQN